MNSRQIRRFLKGIKVVVSAMHRLEMRKMVSDITMPSGENVTVIVARGERAEELSRFWNEWS